MADQAGDGRVTGEGLVLREWTEADLPAMVELFDNPEVARWTPLASPFDLVAAARYLDAGHADTRRLHLAITTDGRQPLGEVLLSLDHRSIGLAITPTSRGEGLAVRALDLITTYAHETLAFPRVIAEIEPGNTASQLVAHRAGYRPAAEEPQLLTSRGREIVVVIWEHLAAASGQDGPMAETGVRLVGDGLVLREWREGDLPAMVELFDDPAVAYWTPLVTPFDERAAKAYLEVAQADNGRIQLAITTDGGRPMGEVLLMPETLSAGYAVGSQYRGQGLAARAVNLITAYAHDVAGMPRVMLEIEAENEASNSVARRAGYRLTEVEPRWVTEKGRKLALYTWEHLA
ncbi:GNAT family N-acetyltransferase [Kribbella sp. CA-293567]|uniref:GNAT family N-acetyltransferase n=1 Tax=Kribbella sp. CA-293567 TaxID=3002436 RepID=UPI0022DD1FCA|nr:GNAT family N-acetyltransferase [Kribbella sp. CA-293567]WBQ06165.1 GNAT family N-acetyltransferase [Kribbella sp. CA-293567]